MLTTDPFALLADLERQFEQRAPRGATRQGWLPAADMVVTDDEIRIVMDAPGVASEDLTIEVHDGVLTIAGERKPIDLAGSSAHRIERGWGSWTRTLRLRDGLDPDAIAADLTDGVLTVTIPVPQAQQPRRIAVGSGARRALDESTAGDEAVVPDAS